MAQAVAKTAGSDLPPVPVTSTKTLLFRFLLGLMCIAASWTLRDPSMR